MNKEVKDAWLAALRSGDYSKTKGYLHTKDGYCCLGVLCDLWIKQVGVNQDVNWSSAEYEGVYMLHEDMYILPEYVIDWAELKEDNPYIHGEKLSLYNDGQECNERTLPHSFLEIADLIEQYL